MSIRHPESWSQRYGQRHELVRITDFPGGMDPPARVRIYRRRDHYVLQVWDPSQKRSISDRVDGDLLAALIRARQIDDRVKNYRRSGIGRGSANHSDLVERYTADLTQRADAGEISPRTVVRYKNALRHYLGYVDSARPNGTRGIHQVDREFQLGLTGYLKNLRVSPNGHSHTKTRPLVKPEFILDVIRGMYVWAADPQRGDLLGDGFNNPFTAKQSRRRLQRDLLTEPAITQSMAAEFLSACDEWQRPIFAAVLLWGLRPSELSWIFRESCSNDLVAIRSLPEIDYFTKGRRDKKVPILPELDGVRFPDDERSMTGLLFRRRSADLSTTRSFNELVAEYRGQTKGITAATERQRIRKQLHREFGGVDYDTMEREFHAVARKLKWPRTATLKGFRHLFATSLENAGMPEFYRRYLMAQSNGNSAIVTYTHLNQIREQYERAITVQLPDVLATLRQAVPDVSAPASSARRKRA